MVDSENKKEKIEIKISPYPLRIVDLFLNILGDSRGEVIEFILRKWSLDNLRMISVLGLDAKLKDLIMKK